MYETSNDHFADCGKNQHRDRLIPGIAGGHDSLRPDLVLQSLRALELRFRSVKVRHLAIRGEHRRVDGVVRPSRILRQQGRKPRSIRLRLRMKQVIETEATRARKSIERRVAPRVFGSGDRRVAAWLGEVVAGVSS